MSTIAVFSGSGFGQSLEYAWQARNLGGELVARKVELVCGGGGSGLMKILADAVLDNGGVVRAVVPAQLEGREKLNERIVCVTKVATINERKALIQTMADAFVILPGGIGVMDELFDVYSQAKLGFQRKPIGILNIGNFFDPLLLMLDNIVHQEFMKEKHLALIAVNDDVRVLLDSFAL